LLNQSSHHPTLVEAVARTIKLGGAAGQFQGAADGHQGIQRGRTVFRAVQKGIQKCGAPQGDAGGSEGKGWTRIRQLRGESPAVPQHGEKIPAASRGIAAAGQRPAGPRTPEIQAKHRETLADERRSEPPLPPIVATSPQAMNHHHQPPGSFRGRGIQPGEQPIAIR
jgi:hypothetical protein